MKTWTLDCVLEVYEQIASRQKTVEGRAPDPNRPDKNYGEIVSGDILIIRAVDNQFMLLNHPRPFVRRPAYVRTYQTARALLEQEGLQRVLPGVTSIEEGVALYHSFPGYKEREEKHGMVAIGLE